MLGQEGDRAIMQQDANTRQITQISVDGLLGRFDHRIDFDPAWQYLIVHGPNGIGKTRLLQLLNSLFSQTTLRLMPLPFHRARVDFDDGAWIEVSKHDQPSQTSFDLNEGDEPEDQRASLQRLYWNGALPGMRAVHHTEQPEISADDRRILQRIERNYPVERIGYERWLDRRTNEELELYDLIERFDVPVPTNALRTPLPEQLAEIISGCKVHLIETQRLMTDSPRSRPAPTRIDGPAQQPTVVSYGDDLARNLALKLAENSRVSQNLDRSFPERLLSGEAPTRTVEDIRSQYEEQMRLRERLAEVSILDGSQELQPDLQLPDRQLAQWELKILSIYLEDAEAKLSTFGSLLNRLELLRTIINDLFLFKRFEINQSSGFAFQDEETGEPVGLRHLSSGEQHELILIYDLLMKVDPHTLVLIDEPEISLHVAWQKVFIENLSRIADLNPLRFLIATHSPQIVGGRWDQSVSLYTPPTDE